MTKTFASLLFILAYSLMVTPAVSAQCGTFKQSGDEEAALNAHVIYRQAIKRKDYKAAFPEWQKAFSMAPAADGKRSTQYIDGIEIYKYFLSQEQDAGKKAEYTKKIKDLFDQWAQCYQEEAGLAMGRKAYDLLYTFNAPREEIFEAGMRAVEDGRGTEYIALYPLTEAVLYLFPEKAITKEQARDAYQKMMALADKRIAAKQDVANWQKAKKDIQESFTAIEAYIFDCDYFKKKLLPAYQADPDNFDVVKSTYTQLIQHGCTKDDPEIAALASKYDAMAAQINAEREAEFEANNPNIAAKKLYDQGDYRGAAAKYEEAIAKETDSEKKAGYLMALASIQGRKLGQYSQARKNALQAAKLRPNWGKPFMLIGDLYAKTGKKCGDAFNARLAIIAAVEKYQHAKSIDPSLADEAAKKIAIYRHHYPDKGEAHMRGLTPGQPVKVKCWIGETVKLRVSNN